MRRGGRCLGTCSASLTWASVASASQVLRGLGEFLASGASFLPCGFLAAAWGDRRGSGAVGWAAWLIWASRRSAAQPRCRIEASYSVVLLQASCGACMHAGHLDHVAWSRWAAWGWHGCCGMHVVQQHADHMRVRASGRACWPAKCSCSLHAGGQQMLDLGQPSCMLMQPACRIAAGTWSST